MPKNPELPPSLSRAAFLATQGVLTQNELRAWRSKFEEMYAKGAAFKVQAIEQAHPDYVMAQPLWRCGYCAGTDTHQVKGEVVTKCAACGAPRPVR